MIETFLISNTGTLIKSYFIDQYGEPVERTKFTHHCFNYGLTLD